MPFNCLINHLDYLHIYILHLLNNAKYRSKKPNGWNNNCISRSLLYKHKDIPGFYLLWNWIYCHQPWKRGQINTWKTLKQQYIMRDKLETSITGLQNRSVTLYQKVLQLTVCYCNMWILQKEAGSPQMLWVLGMFLRLLYHPPDHQNYLCRCHWLNPALLELQLEGKQEGIRMGTVLQERHGIL